MYRSADDTLVIPATMTKYTGPDGAKCAIDCDDPVLVTITIDTPDACEPFHKCMYCGLGNMYALTGREHWLLLQNAWKVQGIIDEAEANDPDLQGYDED